MNKCCETAITTEHKLKPHMISCMGRIDRGYLCASKTNELNTDYKCTHGKSDVSVLYKNSLQLSVREITDTNSDRVIGKELVNTKHGCIFTCRQFY